MLTNLQEWQDFLASQGVGFKLETLLDYINLVIVGGDKVDIWWASAILTFDLDGNFLNLEITE